jgi:quercetin dioxygenase-like cupin family protein
MKNSITYHFLPIIMVALSTSFASAAERQGINVVRVVTNKDVTGAPGRELTILVIDLVPGGSSGLHTHPGDEYGTVMEGTLMVKIGDADFKPMTVGQTFSAPPNTPMEVMNTSGQPAKFYNVLILEKGKPTSSPVK